MHLYDWCITAICFVVVFPIAFIYNHYRKSVVELQKDLHDNREGLYKLFEDHNTDAISACYHRQIMPQTRISKWNWLNFTITKLLMMVILVVELFICVDVDKFSTGKIYAIVSYWWSFILSTKYLPGLMESVTSLIELNGRLSQQDTGI